jgi:16S rRNA (guanine527-N7)-methyltransferase
MMRMSDEQIRAILSDYLRPLPAGIEFKVQEYVALLDSWNRKIPLTSVRVDEEIVRFHFGESIFAAPFLGEGDGRLADVGSGAGFPGLALKLAKPALEVILIEPNKKKCAFLHEVIRELGLTGVDVMASRFEDTKIPPKSLQFVTSRALGGQTAILSWAMDKLSEAGSVVLWVGGDVLRLVEEKREWQWSQPLLVPSTRGRLIVKGTRND